MLVDVNKLFVPPEIDQLDREAFKPGGSTADAIKALRLDEVEFVREYVAAMPTSIVDAVMGAIYSALGADPRSTVTVAWMEERKYGVNVSQGPPAFDSGRGAVHVLLTGPVPQ